MVWISLIRDVDLHTITNVESSVHRSLPFQNVSGPLTTSLCLHEYFVQLLVVVLVHPDVFAGAQPAYEPVVDAAEQLFSLVRDADDRELWETVEVAYNVGVLQLVDLVKDDDGSRAVVLLEAIDEFVVGRRLPVDVDGRSEVVENLVERADRV